MIKKVLAKFPHLYNSIVNLIARINRFKHRKDANIISRSPRLIISKDLKGKANTITIGNNCTGGFKIRIRGNNNIIEIGSNCFVGKNCSIWVEGNDNVVSIGSDTSMTHSVHINCQENHRKITLGNDCMLSNNIIIRTSDSHPIYDIESGKRINNAKDVTIGNHVWIAPNTKIMKGAEIGDGAIIGSDTTVSCRIEANTLAVGRPARSVKSNVKWTREALF